MSLSHLNISVLKYAKHHRIAIGTQMVVNAHGLIPGVGNSGLCLPCLFVCFLHVLILGLDESKTSVCILIFPLHFHHISENVRLLVIRYGIR